MSALDVLTRKDRARPLDCILFVKNLTGFLVGRTPRRPTQSASTSRFAQKFIIWNALKSCPSGYVFNAAEARAQGHGIFSQTGYLAAYVNLASALGELGRLDEASEAAREVLEQEPDFSINAYTKRLSYRNPSDLERIADGLRRAGLPE